MEIYKNKISLQNVTENLIFSALTFFFKVKEVRETNSITKLVDASNKTTTDDD